MINVVTAKMMVTEAAGGSVSAAAPLEPFSNGRPIGERGRTIRHAQFANGLVVGVMANPGVPVNAVGRATSQKRDETQGETKLPHVCRQYDAGR